MSVYWNRTTKQCSAPIHKKLLSFIKISQKKMSYLFSRGHDHMVVGFTTTCSNSHITTKVVNMIPAHGEVYLIQHYVIKFVSDLRQVGGVLLPPPPNKTDRHDITEILLKMMVNTITLTLLITCLVNVYILLCYCLTWRRVLRLF
jgi:hypothetical protein